MAYRIVGYRIDVFAKFMQQD